MVSHYVLMKKRLKNLSEFIFTSYVSIVANSIEPVVYPLNWCQGGALQKGSFSDLLPIYIEREYDTKQATHPNHPDNTKINIQ